MNAILRNVLAMAVVLTMVGWVTASGKEPTESFAGSYDWKQGGSDELSAEFTPTGEGTWDVKFRFRWSGSKKNWNGTAEGSLAEGGELTGTATSGSRSWVFQASIREGVMRGKHTEIQRGGEEYETGTFELKR